MDILFPVWEMPATASLAQSNTMPQKPVFSRAPILQMTNCAAANGTVRSQDNRIRRLYQKADQWNAFPRMWEGLFRIACLIKNKPLEEPVTQRIYEAIQDTEDGSFTGPFDEQIYTARALFAVFEYNTDKEILKRIALWLRFVEVEFDRCTRESDVLYQPADLMELLVRYYLATGMKSVLRICSKLRAEAFDWTTSLLTFQQSIPIDNHKILPSEINISVRPENLEYDEKEKLINHAEMLADGMRYTLYSGLYSGHSQDLSSGHILWEYLLKHHHAVCGGTTSNPFLSGTASDQPVNNLALAAWTEAFGSQLVLPESEWALDEMIRIVNNGMADCLEREEIPLFQLINNPTGISQATDNKIVLYARITRAVAAAYRYAVMATVSGIRINYLLPAKFMFMIGKQPVVLCTDRSYAVFQCKNSFNASVEIYMSRTENADVSLTRNGTTTVRKHNESKIRDGIFLRTENAWCNEDGYHLEQNNTIITEECHHQGLCFFAGNQLLTVCASEDHYAYAVTEIPRQDNAKTIITLAEIPKWKISRKHLPDIPVLPIPADTGKNFEMIPYHLNKNRIAMFPKAGNACLK